MNTAPSTVVPTRAAYLAAYRRALMDRYSERDSTWFDQFIDRVREHLEARCMGFAHTEPCALLAWRAIGLKGKPTWKVLFSLPA